MTLQFHKKSYVLIIIPVGLIVYCILWMIRYLCGGSKESMDDAHASMKNYGYFGSHNEWIGNDIEGQTNNEMKMDNDMSPDFFVDGEYCTYCDGDYYAYCMPTMRYTEKNWYKMNLKFDRVSNKVTGNGRDTVGAFMINGIYGKINKVYRIAVTKQYIGKHSIEMRVEWNNAVSEFNGRWHLRRSQSICWGSCGISKPKTIDTKNTTSFVFKEIIGACTKPFYKCSYANMLNGGYFKSDVGWICENESNELNNKSIQGSNIIEMNNNNNIFMDGEYDAYYKYSLSLFGKYWYKMNLAFIHDSNEVTGFGVDKVGKFKINGLFSNTNDVSRIALTKQYIAGTRHQVHMRLEYKNNQFIGAWHIKSKILYFILGNKRYKEKQPLSWGKCGFKLSKPKQAIITSNNVDVNVAFLSDNNV